MPTRLLTSFMCPFWKPKSDPCPTIPVCLPPPFFSSFPCYSNLRLPSVSFQQERTREHRPDRHGPPSLPYPAPPSTLSTPVPARSAATVTPQCIIATSPPLRAHKPHTASVYLRSSSYSHSRSRSHSHSPPHSPFPSHSPSRSPTRLPPPPARSALKKPRAKLTMTATSSSLTPDTASASTVASSLPPPTPTRRTSPRSGLLARFLGKNRGAVTAPPLVVVVGRPERKAVRFGGVEEEEEES
ncbi:hypothetical protein B0F90DRAFT_1695832 [Multifurca ochricompacta]|uniref:Uncharacterized protein n=1 Tax=Multifurca ochricompacta TaxID=376703 RepID=A0AAD4QR81_9AGAM|nr:hypothetical protein B0F90DRAFT_1695832 [Multifurca ochricompacta]